MINEENKTEIIDQYLSNTLEGELLAEFEEKLQEDDDFRLEVEAQKLVLRNLKVLGRENLKNRFKQMHREMNREEQPAQERKPKTRIFTLNTRTVWAIAASLALFIVAAIGLYTYQNAGRETGRVMATHTKIPLYRQGEGGLGFADPGKTAVLDSLAVVIISDAHYSHHYQFQDTLKIFLQSLHPDASDMYVEYDEEADAYSLFIDSTAYKLRRGFDRIYPLE